MTFLDCYDALVIQHRADSARRLHLTPISPEELAELNARMDARAQARVDELEQRIRDLMAIETEGVAL